MLDISWQMLVIDVNKRLVLSVFMYVLALPRDMGYIGGAGTT